MRRGESKNREIFPAFSSYSLPYNSKMASWREKSRRKNLPKKSLPPKKFRQIFGARICKKNPPYMVGGVCYMGWSIYVDKFNVLEKIMSVSVLRIYCTGGFEFRGDNPE